MIWPPDYEKEAIRRTALLDAYEEVLNPREVFIEKYKDDPVSFIQDWCWTYDPRNAKKSGYTTMPFLLFPKQIEMVNWLLRCLEQDKDGLLEKCRDMGASWISVAFSIWLWIFYDGAAIGFGSWKEEYVDKIGNPKSIFWKLRYTVERLPDFALPIDFDGHKHSGYMKLINPNNGSTIVGEAGDNIGRGGRTLIYFKDESAHYRNPDLIEAALGDNTNVQIDISSVNGTGNVFYRKRHGGYVDVFIMDWRDHPGKDQEWYDGRKEKAESEGLMHVFAQEVDRDYSSAVEGVIIPSKWVKASIDAHIKLGINPEGIKQAGLDVADEGGDTNALCTRHGFLLTSIGEWGEGDTSYTAVKAHRYCSKNNIKDMAFDSVGVGAGVKAECAKIEDKTFHAWPYNGGSKVLRPDTMFTDGIKNKDMFKNRKAQDWWALRRRFEVTYNAINGKSYEPEDIISLPSNLDKIHKLVNEVSQPTRKIDAAGKLIIDKKPNGSKSPNLADALVMAYAELNSNAPRIRSL